MPKLTDQELDKLFRTASDRVSPAFEPGDWDDMAQKIEHEEKAARTRNISLYSIVMLLALYSLWAPLNQKRDTVNASIVQSQPMAETSDDNKNDPHNHVKSDETFLQKSVTDNSVNKDLPEDLLLKTKSGNNERKLPIGASPVHGGRGEEHEREIDLSVELNSKVGLKSSSRQEQSLDNIIKNKSEVSGAENNLNSVQQSVSEQNRRMVSVTEKNETGINKSLLYQSDDPYAENNDYRWFDTGSISTASTNTIIDADEIIKPIDLIDPASVETVVRKPTMTATHPFYIKLTASPDFSSIDYGSLGNTGVNVGLLAEYGFARHFSVSAGAIWSKKLYNQENPEKSYSAGNWTGKAKMLDGDCRILDIPINVTYYLFPERRTNLFVTIGSSSYIMLKEQYVYTVWANQKDFEYEENFAHENNEWFSMLNVSIGVQHQLNNKFTVQAEPFLKAPISGVGEGKVNLVSTGLFVSLKYRINK